MIGSAKPAEFQALIGDADRLRDSRHYAAAAEAYGAALALMPERTDIRVQYANMLKDSGPICRGRSGVSAGARRDAG
ncbi:MAG: hypothetical protein JO008_20075 [Alphaproteobacteria bacterium]|nr:hypothetical protein [Alphaproteobacteria bacterium]